MVRPHLLLVYRLNIYFYLEHSRETDSFMALQLYSTAKVLKVRSGAPRGPGRVARGIFDFLYYSVGHITTHHFKVIMLEYNAN